MEIVAYLWYISRPFFFAWWAVITGIATLLSLFAVPESGLVLSRSAVAASTLALAALIFLVVSVVVQGFRLYSNQLGDINVKSIHTSEEDDSLTFLLTCKRPLATGALVELRRPIGDTEAPFAIVEIGELNRKGLYEAKTVWISPGHQNDCRTGKFSVSDIAVMSMLQRRTYSRSQDTD
ncbi:MAG: hypothetical protein AAF823_14845 [Planctomycetota bacterium]